MNIDDMNLIEEVRNYHEEMIFRKLYSRKDKRSMFRQWYDLFGLPFKLYDGNGRELVMLEFDEEKENKFVDDLDKMFNDLYDIWIETLMYGGVVKEYEKR